jgi:hypothetical protein
VRGVRKSKNQSPSPSQRGGWELTDQELKELSGEELLRAYEEAKAESKAAKKLYDEINLHPDVIKAIDEHPVVKNAVKHFAEADYEVESEDAADVAKAETRFREAANKAVEEAKEYVRNETYILKSVPVYAAASAADHKAFKYKDQLYRELMRRSKAAPPPPLYPNRAVKSSILSRFKKMK